MAVTHALLQMKLNKHVLSIFTKVFPLSWIIKELRVISFTRYKFYNCWMDKAGWPPTSRRRFSSCFNPRQTIGRALCSVMYLMMISLTNFSVELSSSRLFSLKKSFSYTLPSGFCTFILANSGYSTLHESMANARCSGLTLLRKSMYALSAVPTWPFPDRSFFWMNCLWRSKNFADCFQ